MKARQWNFKVLVWRYRKLPNEEGLGIFSMGWLKTGAKDKRRCRGIKERTEQKVEMERGGAWGRTETRLQVALSLKNYAGGVKKFESVAQMERMPVDAWKKAEDVLFISVALVREMQGVLISKPKLSQNFRKERINLVKPYGSVSYRCSELNDILLCFSYTNRLPLWKSLSLGKYSSCALICLCINGRVCHCCNFLLRDYPPLSISFIPTVNKVLYVHLFSWTKSIIKSQNPQTEGPCEQKILLILERLPG